MTDVALRFGAKDDGLDAKITRVNKQLDSVKDNAERVAGGIDKAFKALAAAGAVAAVGSMVSGAVEFADTLVKVNAQTGINIENLQEQQFLAEQSSVAFENFAGGINKLQRALVDADEGGKKTNETLAALGFSVDQFLRLSPDEQFNKVAKAIAEIPDPAERTARAVGIFGKAGAELLPLMEAITKEGEDIADTFIRIGGPVSEEIVRKVDALGDSFSASVLAAKSLSVELVGLAAPALQTGLEWLQSFFGGLRVLIGEAGTETERLHRELEDLQKQKAFQMLLGGNTKDIQGKIDAMQRRQRELLGLQQPGDADAEAEYQRYLALREAVLLKYQQTLLQQFGYTDKRLQDSVDAAFRKIQTYANLPLPFEPAFDDPTKGGPLKFEETDDQKKARERLEQAESEHRQRLLRIEMDGNEQRIKAMDDLFDKERKLGEQSLEESLDRERRKTLDTLRVHTDGETFLASVRDTFRIREINLEEIKNQSIAGLATEMFGTLARENSKFAKLQQGIALAQTIWYTAAGIMNAFRTLPWPASLNAAAKVAITGAIQVAKIRSTNYNVGGGSAPTVFGGSTAGSADQAAPVLPEAAKDTRGTTTIYVSGFITRDTVDEMIGAIRDEFSRDVIVIPQDSLQAQVLRGAA